MLYTVLMVAEILVAIVLIALILLQQGKGADMGAAFGAGASGTVFGASGSGNFLSRATGIIAALFLINTLALAYLAGYETTSTSVVDQVMEQQAVDAVDDTPADVPALEPMSDTTNTAADVPEGNAVADLPDAPAGGAGTAADLPQ